MTRNIYFRLLSAIALSIIVCAGTLSAQSTVTGAINGSVTDPQGGVIANASVTVTNIGTNNKISITTSSDGGYRASNLAPGRYMVETTVSGFAPAKADNVVVEVGQVTAVEMRLTIGTATAEVNVTAEAPVINTNDNTNSTNINQTSLSELPINGRRAVNFVLLTPSTVPDGTFGLVSFRGISGVLNNSQVDGGDNNQAWQSEERGRTRIGYVVSQSAIREFQVNTSNYSAEYGRSAGGVVNTVTKSGTNEFHGEVFEFYRNNRFGARNPLAFKSVLNSDFTTGRVAYKPVDIRHQFGANVCGPIAKNHLFFCFTYDQQKRNFPGLAILSNPNYINTVNRTTLTGLGVTTPQIDSTLAFINSLTGEVERRGDQKLYFPKIDWNINKNNILTASYNHLRWFSPAGLQTQATNTNARHSFGDDVVKTDTFNTRLQSTISSNILNEARFQYSYELGQAFSSAPLPGEPATATTSQGQRSPQVVLTNGLTFGTTTNFERNAYPDERRYQFADAVTWSKGSHTIKFGGEYSKVTDRIDQLFSQAGSFTYADINNFIVDYVKWQTPTAPITACATAGTGRVVGKCYTSNFSQGIGIQGLTVKIGEYAFFGQDDFRVTPRLTVNLGLRWEYQKLPTTPLPNASTVVIPQDGRTLNQATSTLPNDKNNFGPRFGFAYDLMGDGKTSIRGGFGVYYGRMMVAQIYNSMLNTGNPNGAGTVSLNNTAGPTFPNILANNSVSLAAAGIQFYQPNFQAPLIYQYDMILERQLAKNMVVSVSYIGSLGRDLPTFIDLNLVPTGASTVFSIVNGPLNGQTFSLPQYARPAGTPAVALTQIQSSVTSQYDGLVFQANRRFTNGLQFQASYTLAKATDTNQNSSIFPAANSTYDTYNRSYDAGYGNNDVRHKVSISAVYSPTLYKGGKGSFGNYVANGWTFSPIVSYYSGKPFDSFVGNLNGSNGNGRFPLDARNAYRLPSVFNTDLRVSKRFNFTERYNVEILAEGFNIFNRTQVFQKTNALYTRSGNILTYSTAFGTISGTDSFNYRERQIQFAARFHF
ncbi:TonB-dependent receptor [soil metagenome]